MVSRVSYVLPLRTGSPVSIEFLAYLAAIARWDCVAEVIVVDGSDPEVFDNLERRRSCDVRHAEIDARFACLKNGKVAGVLTGVRLTSHQYLVLADDDVRYDECSLLEMGRWLAQADVVAPQNYFDPLPWHACLDSARTLINRVTGGDWPGTLGVRRSAILATGGYDGDVLFENLELIRTMEAAGGVVARPLDLFVRRLPPSAHHFWSQRVRQAYDEFARPGRLLFWLGVLPVGTAVTASGGPAVLALVALLSMLIAQAGRIVAGGRRVFPLRTVVVAPLWVLERAICAWLAVASRLIWGGVPYGGRILARAATPARLLRRRTAPFRDAARQRGLPEGQTGPALGE